MNNILIGRTGLDTTSSIPDPTLSLSRKVNESEPLMGGHLKVLKWAKEHGTYRNTSHAYRCFRYVCPNAAG